MPVLGLNCKFYINTGTYASPTWTEFDSIRDLALEVSPEMGDVSKRADLFKLFLAGQNDVTISGNCVYDSADTPLGLVQAAVFSATPASKILEVAMMDGDISTSGSEGIRMSVSCSQFGRDEPIGDGSTVPLAFKPAPSSDAAPAWYTVS